jgi:hypothetical protein
MARPTTVSENITVSKFTEIPPINRSNAGGRRGPNAATSSPELTAARGLEPGKFMTIKVPGKDTESFAKMRASIASRLNRKGALPYKPVIRAFPEQREIRVYCPTA